MNLILHGHSPLVSEMVARAAQDPELLARAQELGAKGINLAGLCCTGNEVLMRQGIPMAGNHLVQELALITGAVEAMVVDYQCIMPSLGDLAACYHTKFYHHLPQGQVSGRHPPALHPGKRGGAGPGTGGPGSGEFRPAPAGTGAHPRRPGVPGERFFRGSH